MEESNLVRARSSIVWILAIVCAFAAVWWIERNSGKQLIASGPVLAASPDLPAEPAPRALTERERQWARIAWAYFEKNANAQTGLVNSVDNFGSTTMWDAASSLMALLAARDLALVDAVAFDARLSLALQSLARIPLYANALPNKAYDVATLAMTDYDNKPAPQGIGWSAIDLGRLIVPLNVIVWRHPQHTAAARAVIARWDTKQLARDGLLLGMEVRPGAAAQSVQEGRGGYEQYAARTLALMGVDADRAADPLTYLRLVDVGGVKICADNRSEKEGARTFITSDPYVLAGMELGFGRSLRECAWRLYRAQEARHRKSGVLTAVGEDNVDRAPWFVYNTAHSGGRDWVALTEKGEDASALRSLSVKSAFGWHALYRTPYTTQLVEAVAGLHDPARGWYAGLYEEGRATNKSLTANTNAVVLESLAYIARGRLLSWREATP
ncbi:DUF3131 domain-containing protein [Ramlibacter sp.]|uniref:DUF3131 domain-containing protein n=1 Tax=Ramlibacter sp. TaxID=1917967 RepID=UPI003D127A8B